MDPNTTLVALRSIVRAINDGSHEIVDAVDVATICDSFAALDDWLSSGGFLPEDWQR